MVSFHQISKMGENIKVDICKCPINVELVKKSSNRPGHLQMPFQIHLHLCALYRNRRQTDRSRHKVLNLNDRAVAKMLKWPGGSTIFWSSIHSQLMSG